MAAVIVPPVTAVDALKTAAPRSVVKALVPEKPKVCGFTALEEVGCGSYSRVYKIIDEGKEKALKVPLTTERYSNEGIAELIEYAVLTQFDHPHVLHAERIVQDAERKGACLVLPLATISLHHYVVKHIIVKDAKGNEECNPQLLRKPLPVKAAIDLAYKVACGFAFLLENNILHLDVKAANILLQETKDGLVPKISDFGMAVRLDDPKMSAAVYREVIAAAYRPPDLFGPSPHMVGEHTLVWELAMVFQYLFGQYHVPGTNNEAVLGFLLTHYGETSKTHITNLFMTYIEEQDILANAVDLVSGMLRLISSQRLSMEQVLNHPLFHVNGKPRPRIRGRVLSLGPLLPTLNGKMDIERLLTRAPAFFPNFLPAGAVFQAASLLYRSLPLISFETPDRRSVHSFVCLFMALKIYFWYTKKQVTIEYLSKQGSTWKYEWGPLILEMEREILIALKGQILDVGPYRELPLADAVATLEVPERYTTYIRRTPSHPITPHVGFVYARRTYPM